MRVWLADAVASNLRELVAAGKLSKIALVRHGRTNKMADDLARRRGEVTAPPLTLTAA